MCDVNESSGRKPGRPLEAGVSRRIDDAVLGLLAAKGYQGLAISEVAERAGIPRSTLYRRGATRASLTVNAISAVVPPIRDVDTGRPLADLAASIADFITRFIADEHTPVVMELHALALRDTELADLVATYLRPRGKLLDDMIGRARSAGVVDERLTSGMIRDLVIGPLMYRWLIAKDVIDAEVVAVMLDAAMRGVAAITP